jgi:hypothetical protein
MEESTNAHLTWYYNTYKDLLEQMVEIIDRKYPGASDDELAALINGGDSELYEIQKAIMISVNAI